MDKAKIRYNRLRLHDLSQQRRDYAEFNQHNPICRAKIAELRREEDSLREEITEILKRR